MMRWLIGGLSDCYDYFEPMLLKGLNMSLTAAYCALAVMVLRLLLKKQPKVYSYALWLIVAFRLLCPVSFENMFSLMRISPESIPADITSQHVPTVSTGIGGVDVVVNQVLTNFESCVNPLSIWMFFGSILWLLVAAGLFGYGIGSYWKMRMELKDATETEPGVWVSERLKTPFVLGFFKPAVYLPAGLSDAEKAYVLEHERIHIGRGDHLVKAGAFLLLCVHWFNPVLWVSYFLMCKDMEMSCDEKVIKKLSADHTVETKKDYASTLLALASNHQFSLGGPLAFGEGNIKKRITNVLQYKKRTVVVSAVLAVVVLAVIFLFAGNPKSEKETGGVQAGAITPTPTPDGTQLTIHLAPKTTYTAEELAAYAAWQEESLGTKLKENVYYREIKAGEIGTPYFNLEVPADCVDKVSYLLILEEKEDGTKAVSELQFFYTAATQPKEVFVTEPRALSDYFVESSWLGGIGWATVEDYYDVPDDMLIDWVNRISSTGIRQLEPIYQAETAPFGRAFVWVNAEDTGAYFYYQPTDVQWSAEFETEFLELEAVLKKYFDITFFAEPDAISWDAFVEKLKNVPSE